MGTQALLPIAAVALASALALATGPTRAAAEPAARVARTVPRAATPAEERRYAEREATAADKQELERFEGGQVYIYLSAGAALVLLVVLLVLLL